MKTIVFLLEEPSAKALLEGVLPRIMPRGVASEFIVFEGKQDLEKQMERKLRLWRRSDSSFIVLRDKDSGDCRSIKATLVTKCNKAGKPETLVRIACHSLESFYLGDLAAVEAAFEMHGIHEKQRKRKYRIPDSLANPYEELKTITEKKYQKVSGSRIIAPHLSLDGRNRSNSFNVLIDGIRRVLTSE